MSLQVGVQTIEFHVYTTTPDDAFLGIMFNAYDSFTGAEILKDLQESNLTMPVVGGRRRGRTSHVLVTMLGECLPRWILYHSVCLRLYPLYPKAEACFNCRKVGHRTDVCPDPKCNCCARCGEEHPPIPQDTQRTCHARCTVCKGGHTKNTSKYKYRFVRKPTPSRYALAQAPDEEPQPQQSSILCTSHSPSQKQLYRPLGLPQRQQQTDHSRPRNRGRTRSRSRSRPLPPSPGPSPDHGPVPPATSTNPRRPSPPPLVRPRDCDSHHPCLVPRSLLGPKSPQCHSNRHRCCRRLHR